MSQAIPPSYIRSYQNNYFKGVCPQEPCILPCPLRNCFFLFLKTGTTENFFSFKVMENTKVSLFSNVGCNEKSRLAASLFIFKSLNLFQNLRLRMSPSENWRHLNLSQPSLIYALWYFYGFSIKGKPMVSNQFITQIYLFYFF